MTRQKLLLLAKISLILLFTLIYSSVSAQVEKDTLLAAQYFKKGDSLLNDSKNDSAVFYFKKALPIYKKTSAWSQLAKCYNKISRGQILSRELEDGLLNAKKGLEVCSTNHLDNTEIAAYANDNIGRYYESLPDYNKALEYYHNSLKIREQESNRNFAKLGVSFTNIGVCNMSISKYDLADDFLQKALQANKKAYGEFDIETADSYNILGILYFQKGEYDKSTQYLNNYVEIIKSKLGNLHLKAGYGYLNIGVIHFETKHYENAIKNYQKALPIFKNNNNKIGEAGVYSNLGNVLDKKLEFDAALQYHKKSLEMRLKIYGPDHPLIADDYNNIGLIYSRQKNYKASIKYHADALRIRKLNYGESSFQVADSYENLAIVYKESEDFERSEENYLKALQIRNTIFNGKHFRIADMMLGVATLYVKKKELDKALKSAKDGLEMMKDLYDDQHFLLITWYLDIAEIYLKKNEYKKAIIYFDKALKINKKDSNQKETTIDAYYDLRLLLATLKGKGKAMLLALLDKKNRSIEEVHQILSLYKDMDDLIEYNRSTILNHNDKVNFAQITKEIYVDVLTADYIAFQIKNEKNFLVNAWYNSEKSRSNVLIDILNTEKAKGFSELPDNVLELEKKLRINRAYYASQLTNAYENKTTDSLQIKKYENKLFDITSRQDSLNLALEQNYPKYHQLKYNNQVISVEEVQQKLDNATTLLEFFTTDSITYAFTISKNNFAVKELNTPGLNDQIEAYRKAITSKNTREFKTQSHALYQLLIAPIKDQLDGNQLIIVPDGPLWHLNFDLLLTQNDPSNNPKNFAYLLKEYAISYANSATLLLNTPTTKGTNKTLQECLAFSFSDSTKTNDSAMVSLATLRDTEDDLPGTREEIRAISNIIDGQYFYGSQAIETNFKKNAEKYNILHLALHGEVDNERPENSRLFFTKSKDSLEDNLLYSHELFALDIPAELTVLSACNTGTGKIAKGEGIMSLGNAFQYAGTKSLLLTSWEVSDQTTPELMKYFYTNLKQGMPKSKALQQAKLSYLQSADVNRTHPFYWGAFYLVGEDTPIAFVNNWLWYWGVGIGVLVLLLGVYFIYQRRSKKPHIQA